MTKGRLYFIFSIMALCCIFLIPARQAKAYVPEVGTILETKDMQVQVLYRGDPSVLIYKHNDVKKKTIAIPETVTIDDIEYKVIGIIGNAFAECTTPNTIKISSMMNFYKVDTAAFLNGKAQTIQVTPKNGEWETLYPVLQFKNEANTYFPGSERDNENTLYIKVPKGTYTLPKSYGIRVYSGTTLYLKGVTYKRNTTDEGLGSFMLSFGAGNGTGYDNAKNISILYGTFNNGTKPNANNICAFSHAENIKITGTTFKYLPKSAMTDSSRNPHCIEMAGCRNVTIKNCKFYNNSKCWSNNEAVQIESCTNDAEASKHTGIAGKLDGTQTSKITITGCYFEGFNYGCGSNHLGASDNFKNMKFTNNTFVGCQNYCICLWNFDKVTITGNKMQNCKALYLDAIGHKSANITVDNNIVIE